MWPGIGASATTSAVQNSGSLTATALTLTASVAGWGGMFATAAPFFIFLYTLQTMNGACRTGEGIVAVARLPKF
jgi:hypothetical protein